VRRIQRRFVVVEKVEAERKKFESRIDRRYWKTVQENLPDALHCAQGT
jgi:hypothetical protein